MNFKINNQVWRIKFVNPNSHNLVRSNGTITIGMTDNITKTIYINNRLNDYMIDKVLCHELTHAFALEFDYYMPIETEEIVADFMSLFGRDIIYQLDTLIEIIKRVA